MEGEEDERRIIGEASIHTSNINKRSLRNKSLSLSFNEKDLLDYVSGFHKRKKKRRKEAQKQIEEKERRLRLEERKRRKEEKEYVLYGGAPPQNDAESNEEEKSDEDELNPVFEITTYEDGDSEIQVTTSVITHSDDEEQAVRKLGPVAPPVSKGGAVRKPNVIPVSKRKAFKKVRKGSSRPKLQNKRDRRKSKINGKKRS